MSAFTPKVRWTRSARVVLSAAFRAAPGRTIAVLVLSIPGPIGNAVFAWWTKVLIDAALGKDLGRALWVAVAIGVTLAITYTCSLSSFLLSTGLQERTDLWIDAHLIELSAAVPGIEHHERPEYLDQISMLRGARAVLTQAINSIVQSIGAVMQVIATVGLLASLHPALALVPLFALPSVWTTARAQRILMAEEERFAEPRRGIAHMFSLATTAPPAKEMRIFGIGDEVVRRYSTLAADSNRVETRARVRASGLEALGWSIFGLGYAGAIAFVVSLAVHHDPRITIGGIVLAIQLAGQVNGEVTGVVHMTGFLMYTMRAAARYVWLIDYAKEHRPSAHAPVPIRIARGIDLENLSFRYPGTDIDILRDVDLHIPLGATLAIVGENGAGKTTLVKLLCRFYEPTSGRITLDGTDIGEFDVEQWRARMSSAFQDFARFELVAREVVGVGDLARVEDTGAVETALTRASACDVVASLPKGLESQLGKSFDDGVDLSGGQWQKLALGRAMMREDPLVLVLDEPTAALDADTEHALFERYAAAARRAASDTGAITVLVSHRFSTVRMADLIVVVENGRISQAGSHEDLVARGGTYAELYEIQARAYR
ncbi:MAG: ABC transporter ATP-binding protein [Actinomycetota bacterium]